VDCNLGPSQDWHSYEVKVQPDTNFQVRAVVNEVCQLVLYQLGALEGKPS